MEVGRSAICRRGEKQSASDFHTKINGCSPSEIAITQFARAKQINNHRFVCSIIITSVVVLHLSTVACNITRNYEEVTQVSTCDK